jgi:hypothetical protein
MKQLTTFDGTSEYEHESTYALLVRSEERSRNRLELIIYPLLAASAIFAIGQFARQSVAVPAPDLKAVHSSALS